MICGARQNGWSAAQRHARFKGIRVEAEKPRDVARPWLSSAASDMAMIGPQLVPLLTMS
jgi:hypothetical protein